MTLVSARPGSGSPVPESFNATTREFPREQTVHGLFAAQAAATPDRIAVRCGAVSASYAQLGEAVGDLAGRLRAAGAGPGQLVGICVERSLDMVVGVLGILESGAAYVPMDPAYPTDRLRCMVEDAAMPVIVTQRSSVDRLPEHRARVVEVGGEGRGTSGEGRGARDMGRGTGGEGPALSVERSKLDVERCRIGPSGEGARSPSTSNVQRSTSNVEGEATATGEDLAYVIFTSGSTGRPKGVRIRHRSVVNFLNSMRREPGLAADDVLLAVTTLSFDIAGLELFLPLTTGATVVIADRETASDGFRLVEELGRTRATVMQATPVTWRMLLEAGWEGSPRLKVLIGGEAVPRDLVEQLLPRCASVWNMYGPTETTIWSTTGRLESGDGPIGIGRPIDNTRVYVVDAELRPVPVGEAGELLIGGAGVADGYLNRPELTAERFVSDPFSKRVEERLYRTGDLARWRSDGTLECLGRMDDQVKIRGHRIELGEVEAALRTVSNVRSAAVAARDDGSGGLRLVAYLVARSGVLDPSEVRQRVRGLLPEYMVPSAWMVLERLPFTPNGKLDRRALPEPVSVPQPTPGPGSGSGSGSGGVSPAGGDPVREEDRRMTLLWAEVLRVPRVGMTDNFFELGGNSLVAVRLFARIEREFGRRLPLASLLGSPTPSGVLALLSGVASGEAAPWRSLVPLQAGSVRPPFFCVHGAGGNVLLYRELVRALGSTVAIHGFQSRGLDGQSAPLGTVEAMAAAYVEELLAFQGMGPFMLGGYCMGGTVAYEMARLLHARGERVVFLALFDTYNFAVRRRLPGWRGRFVKAWQKVGFHVGNVRRAPGRGRIEYLREKARRTTEDLTAGWRGRRGGGDREAPQAMTRTLGSVEASNHEAGMAYRPQPCPVKLTVFKPERNYSEYSDPRMGWEGLVPRGLEIVELPVYPHAMLVVPFVEHLARALRERLERVWLDDRRSSP